MRLPESVRVLHPTGNQNVRELLGALEREGTLERFVTTAGWSSAPSLPAVARVAAKRTYSNIGPSKLETHPYRELARIAVSMSPIAPMRRLSEMHQPLGVDWTAQALDRTNARNIQLGRGQPDLLYGYTDYALSSAEAMKAAGKRVVIELPHAHWAYTNHMIRAARRYNSEWDSILPLRSGLSHYNSRADRELELADLIVVPSNQVASSLMGLVDQNKITMAPYGCPQVVDPSVRTQPSGPLQVLFVGRLHPLKGLSDLLAVTKELAGSVAVTVIGHRPSTESPQISRLLQAVNYLGVLPRKEVLAAMTRSDIFFLPSMVEGRSLAALEALSTGLPLVVTPGSGVDDLALKGAGRVVESGDVEGMVDAISQLRDTPGLLEATSRSAIRIAKSHQWVDTYTGPVLAAIGNLS